MVAKIQQVSEIGTKVRNAETEVIINIISDFVIWSKTSFLVADLINVHNPKNGTDFHPAEYYNGIFNAIDLLGVKDIKLRAELSELSLEYLDNKELSPRQIAEEIYMDWLVAIKDFSLQKMEVCHG